MRIMLMLTLALVAGCARNPSAPGGVAPVVALRVVSVEVLPGVARIVWSVQEGVTGTFLVQRRLEGAPWKALAHVPVDAASRLTLEDVSVQPGVTYAYRVRIALEPEALYAGDVTLQIPPQ